MPYDPELSGLLFPEREKKSDRSPDYTGKATIDGVEYRLAGWKKTGQRGPFLSLKFSLPQGRRDEEEEAF